MTRITRRGSLRLNALAGSLLLILAARPADIAAQQEPRGKAVYDKWCAGCHGDKGDGDGHGARFMLPHPRDFSKGVFKIRTTASGEIPTDADLRHVIDEGMPGTAMPEWKSRLSDKERDDVAAYIKTFTTFFSGTTAKAIDIGKAPTGSEAAIADGRATFTKLECFKCHGQDARGDGKSAPTLKDDWGNPIRAADLTESWKFRGGSTVEQIYTRLRTGLDGTPMPSFTDAIENKVITEEQLWHLAQYVRSLSSKEPPAVREVVRARLVATLPRAPGDSAWNAAERYWVPVVGQIVVKPRWFAPTVDGVWVQALHDNRSLALRVTWHDPSQSPAPPWDEWLGRVSQAMSDVDGALATQQGPDRLTIEFPATRTDDAERPYFLEGSTRTPAYVWRWSSTPDSVTEGTATGLGHFTARTGAAEVAHAASFTSGEWSVQFSRPLASADSHALSFVRGEAIPIGFFVADGSSGEDEVRGSVSTWYAIYLDVPTPRRVYIAPVLSMLLTAGLGATVVSRAQRRARRAELSQQEA